jgi:hypothetical protein
LIARASGLPSQGRSMRDFFTARVSPRGALGRGLSLRPMPLARSMSASSGLRPLATQRPRRLFAGVEKQNRGRAEKTAVVCLGHDLKGTAPLCRVRPLTNLAILSSQAESHRTAGRRARRGVSNCDNLYLSVRRGNKKTPFGRCEQPTSTSLSDSRPLG